MRRGGISFTLVLVVIDVIIYLVVSSLAYNNPGIMDFVALKPLDILAGRNLWTIFTSMFMHASPWHLIMNMLSLIFLGSFLERLIGKRRFIWIYFLSGIFASLFFVFFASLFNIDINASAVGASGAIFGIAGTLAVLTPKLPVFIMFIPIAMPMWFAIILIMVVLWVLSLIANLPIGNTAHLGGLIVGLICGFYLRARYKKKVYLLNRLLGSRW